VIKKRRPHNQPVPNSPFSIPNLSPPYLHDSSIAVGKDIETELGLPGTLLNGIRPDPANSLSALIDRNLRSRLIRLYEMDQDLRDVKVTGRGFWVDKEKGFSAEEQEALILYLLTLPPPS
jgi:hypothetical protein